VSYRRQFAKPSVLLWALVLGADVQLVAASVGTAVLLALFVCAVLASAVIAVWLLRRAPRSAVPARSPRPVANRAVRRA
jgi:hypothetical protein